jgi:hypothetical protein
LYIAIFLEKEIENSTFSKENKILATCNTVYREKATIYSIINVFQYSESCTYSQINISLASSLVEPTPATQAAGARFPAGTCLPQGALLGDRENLGQVSP